jgi:hypothetical protein
VDEKYPQNVGLFRYYQKSKRSSNKRKIAQSGHPAFWQHAIRALYLSFCYFLADLNFLKSERQEPQQKKNRRVAEKPFQKRGLNHEWQPGLPDFSWYNIPKLGKCTELPFSVLNNNKIYQMTVK